MLLGLKSQAQLRKTNIIICSDGSSDIGSILKANNYSYRTIGNQLAAVKAVKNGGGILFVADGYPAASASLLVERDTVKTQLERAIVNTSKIKGADSLALIGIHNAYVVKSTAKKTTDHSC